MDIRNTRELKTFAAQRLENAPLEKRIVLIYAALSVGLSALTAIASYALDKGISQYGGLSNMGIRTMLSTIQTMLPLLQSVVLMCLDVGYMAAALRIARGQYSSPQTLRLGFDRFWVLLRCSLIIGLFYFGIAFASLYVAVMIFMLTPLSEPVVAALSPYLSDATILDSGIVLDDAAYAQISSLTTPAFLIFGLLFLLLAFPVFYRFRMVNYVIIDRPGCGAMFALRESRKMMRRNTFRLMKLDISLWWYYLAAIAVSVVCYGDEILPLLGVELPFSPAVNYFLFYSLYWLLEILLHYFLRNPAEVTYSLAYDALKPEQPKDNGVVLGNIFQM